MLKNRNNLPPGGYVFYQPETGWSPNPWVSFDDQVKAIVEHRQANPRFNLSTNSSEVAQQLDDYTTLRLEKIPGGNNWLVPNASAPPPESFQRHLPHRPAVGAAGVADYAKDVVAGIGLWTEWFGSKPVDKKTAEKRAAICVDCPKNVRGNWMQKFSEAAGTELLSIMGSMKKQKMQTKHDDSLGVCGVCNCPMKAKVWSPMDLIQKHMRDEHRPELWEKCWIRQNDD